MKIFSIAIVSCVLLGCTQPGFSEQDVRQTEESIRTEFNKKEGVRVTNVQMIRESPRKLMGIASMSVSLYGQHIDVTKSCSATMGDNNSYIWRCE